MGEEFDPSAVTTGRPADNGKTEAPADQSSAPPPPPPHRPPPPPPPRPPTARGGAIAETDFAAAAAMVNDILSVDSEVNAESTEDQGALESESELSPIGVEETQSDSDADSEVPMAPDFFTSSRPKKRFWHLK